MGPDKTQDSSTAGTFAERRSNEIRDRILSAAVRLFGEVGYTATTMERIAIEAKVARATVFNYFEQKELLLGAVLQVHYLGFAALMESGSDSPVPLCQRILDALDQWIVGYTQDIEKSVSQVRSWVYAGGPYLPGSDATVDMLTEKIRAEQESGRIHTTESAVVIARAFSDVVTGAIVRWTTEDAPTTDSLRDSMLAAARTITIE